MRNIVFLMIVAISSVTFGERNSHGYGSQHDYDQHYELLFDLQGVQIPKYDDRSTKEVLQSAVNYFVNQLGQNGRERLCLLQNADAERLATAYEKQDDYTSAAFKIKKLSLANAWAVSTGDWDKYTDESLTKHCVDFRALQELTDNYPYACRANFAKNGYPYRLDFLIYRLMDQEFYHRANKIPKNANEVSETLGDDLVFNNYNIPRTVIKDSIVTQDYRAIGILENYYDSKKYPGLDIPLFGSGNRNNPHFNTILTFDFNKEIKKNFRSDFFSDPINTDVAAIEAFLVRKNGLWDYLVFDIKKQQRLDTAPGGVADFSAGLTIDDGFASVKAHKRFNSIRNGIDCMTCHAGGIQSGQLQSENKAIIRALKLVAKNKQGRNDLDLARKLYNVPEGTEDSDLFEDSYKVRTGLADSNKLFTKALDLMGVRKNNSSIPLLPDFHAIYSAPLNLEQAALELGVSSKRLATVLESVAGKYAGVPGYDPAHPDKWSISREVYEQFFCKLYDLLAGKNGDYRDKYKGGYSDRNDENYEEQNNRSKQERRSRR